MEDIKEGVEYWNGSALQFYLFCVFLLWENEISENGANENRMGELTNNVDT